MDLLLKVFYGLDQQWQSADGTARQGPYQVEELMEVAAVAAKWTFLAQLEGTGLGLVISQRLAREMGGDVAVTSNVGQGSCLGVTLRLDSLSPELPDECSVTSNITLANVSALTVDDHSTTRPGTGSSPATKPSGIDAGDWRRSSMETGVTVGRL